VAVRRGPSGGSLLCGGIFLWGLDCFFLAMILTPFKKNVVFFLDILSRFALWCAYPSAGCFSSGLIDRVNQAFFFNLSFPKEPEFFSLQTFKNLVRLSQGDIDIDHAVVKLLQLRCNPLRVQSDPLKIFF